MTTPLWRDVRMGPTVQHLLPGSPVSLIVSGGIAQPWMKRHRLVYSTQSMKIDSYRKE